ncbi:MAG: class I SAM-dependent methyltransferase [Kiritimatiellales bacterium]|nr:class I SAM-dependent methyltransferase [Kiritimatiellota bacterium]MBL7011632.1 class I SAM-dependent methyltransferase [Kiritimatiellales bacterium]
MDIKFYQERYKQGDQYGRAEYNLDSFLKTGCVKQWLSRKEALRVLDVGCGSGLFLRQISACLGGSDRISKLAGIDLVNVLDEAIAPDVDFGSADLNKDTVPLPESSHDLIFCNHLIEHLFETEHLMGELHRLAAPDSLVVISTPNLAWWANPFFLFLGLQPIGTEVGSKTITYGLGPLGKRLKGYGTAGHIRAFTPRALSDMAKAVGFEPIGWWSQNRSRILQLLPRRERNMGLILQKKKLG